MHPFEELVAGRFLSAAELTDPKVKILVALSGGPDSVSLLMALKAGLPQTQIFACHVNHGLRGEASQADAQFCRELCERLNVPFQLDCLNLGDEGESHFGEECLRELRYQALLRVAKKLAISYVVSGHTLGDQIETMLFRLFRGTSTGGLAAMKAVRPLGFEGEITLVRPMLNLERAAIEEYLQKTDLTARIDESNANNNYTRNFLRLDIIPLLLQRFPKLLENMAHLQVICSREDEFLNQMTRAEINGERGPGLSIEKLQHLHIALRSRVIAQLMRDQLIEPSFARVERVLEAIAQNRDTRQSLSDGFDLSIKSAQLKIVPTGELACGVVQVARARLLLPPVFLPLPQSGTKNIVVPWLDKAVKIEALANLTEPAEQSFPHRQALSALVDLSNVDGELTFRPRQDGDIIWPLGMPGIVRLKQYLHANRDRQVPAQELLKQLNDTLAQRLTPVLADSKEVLWVPGYGLSEKVKVRRRATHGITLLEIETDINSEESGFC